MCCKSETPTLKSNVTVRKFQASDGAEVWHKARGPRRGGGTQSDVFVLPAADGSAGIDTFGYPLADHSDGVVIRRTSDGEATKRSSLDPAIGGEFTPTFNPTSPGYASTADTIETMKCRPFVNLDLIWVAGTAIVDGDTVDVVQAYNVDTLAVEFQTVLTDVGDATLLDIQPSPHGCLVHRRTSDGNWATHGIVERIDADGTIGAAKEYDWYITELSDNITHHGDWGGDAVGFINSVCICPDGKVRFFTADNPPLQVPRITYSDITLVVTDTDLELAAPVALTYTGDTFDLTPATRIYDSLDDVSPSRGPRVGFRRSDTGAYIGDIQSGFVGFNPHNRVIRASGSGNAIVAIGYLDEIGDPTGIIWPTALDPADRTQYLVWDGSGGSSLTQFSPFPVAADSEGAELFTAGGHISFDGLGIAQFLAKRNATDDPGVEWHTQADHYTGLGVNQWWTPLRTVYAWSHDSGNYYLVGRPQAAQDDNPYLPTAVYAHVELFAIGKAGGSPIWLARHSADPESPSSLIYDAAYDVAAVGGAVYMVGEESTYRP